MQGKTLNRMAAWTVALLLVPGVMAQEPAAKPAKVPVFVLGTYHFANPNLDYVKTDVKN